MADLANWMLPPEVALPTCEYHVFQQTGADVWREFWRKVEEGTPHELMSEGQRRMVRGTLDFLAWAVENADRVEPRWEGLRQYLEMVGTISSLQRARGGCVGEPIHIPPRMRGATVARDGAAR